MILRSRYYTGSYLAPAILGQSIGTRTRYEKILLTLSTRHKKKDPKYAPVIGIARFKMDNRGVSGFNIVIHRLLTFFKV